MTEAAAPRRTDVLSAVLEATTPVDRVQVTRVELAPGQQAGAHHHRCDVVGTVLSGSIRFAVAGAADTVLHAGDPFFEPRNAHVLHFDNASADRPAVFLAGYLVTAGTEEMITMGPPPGAAGCCSGQGARAAGAVP